MGIEKSMIYKQLIRYDDQVVETNSSEKNKKTGVSHVRYHEFAFESKMN